MPRVELSAKSQSHNAAGRTRVTNTDAQRPADPFASLLEGTGDAAAPARERAQPQPGGRTSVRSTGETRPASAPARSHEKPDAAEPAERPDAEEATVPDAALETAATETVLAESVAVDAEAILDVELGADETTEAEGVEADLLVATPEHTAAQIVPANEPPPAPAPPPGLQIAAAVAAPPAQDAIAAAADRAAAEDAPVADVVAAPPARAAAPVPAAPVPAAPPSDRKAAAPAADAAADSDARPTTDGAPPADTVAPATEGAAEHERHDTRPHAESKGEHAQSDVAGRRGAPTHAPDPASASAPNDPQPGEAAPAGRPALETSALGHLQGAPERQPTAAVAHTAPADVGTPTATTVPVAGLAVEIAARAQAGRNRFEIRLDPPELGRIEVRLDVDRSGQVTSRLTVERAETLDLLRRDAPELERALQQAGLKTADNGLQFALRDQGFAGRDQDRPTPAAERVIVPDPELDALESAQRGYARLLRPGGGIDIRV